MNGLQNHLRLQGLRQEPEFLSAEILHDWTIRLSTRSVDHTNARKRLDHRVRQLDAVHPGHADVGQQHIDRSAPALAKFERLDPSEASITSKPLQTSRNRSRSRMSGSSSTTRTVERKASSDVYLHPVCDSPTHLAPGASRVWEHAGGAGLPGNARISPGTAGKGRQVSPGPKESVISCMDRSE
jgi:hypothetical protein